MIHFEKDIKRFLCLEKEDPVVNVQKLFERKPQLTKDKHFEMLESSQLESWFEKIQ